MAHDEASRSTAVATDGTPPRRWRWLAGGLLAAAAVGLAGSDGVWGVLGMIGLLAGFPLGVLPALLLVPLLLFALVFTWRAALFAGPWLLRALGLDRVSAQRGRVALWAVAGSVLAVGIATTIALAPERGPADDRALCTREKLVLDAGRALSRLMGHGRVPAAANCRGVARPPLAPLLPALLACAMLLSLLAAHERHRLQEQDRRDQARRDAFVRGRAAGAAAPRATPPAAAGYEHAADTSRPPPPLSARSAALMARRRAAGARPATDWLAPLRRWPVLGSIVACYVAGWALTLAGSDAAERLAAQLAPAGLWRAQPGWAVPGLWLSACAGIAVGIAAWLRRRNG